jgi:hypothetical protein
VDEAGAERGLAREGRVLGGDRKGLDRDETPPFAPSEEDFAGAADAEALQNLEAAQRARGGGGREHAEVIVARAAPRRNDPRLDRPSHRPGA